MTTRPIVYEISVDGADGAQRSFQGIATQSTAASHAFNELHRGVSAATQAFSQLSPSLQTAGGVINTLLEGATSLATGGLNPLNLAITGVTTALQLGSIAFQTYEAHQREAQRRAAELARTFGEGEEGRLRGEIHQAEIEQMRLRTDGSNQEFIINERVLRSARDRLAAIEAGREAIAREAREAQRRHDAEQNAAEQNQRTLHDQALALEDLSRGEQQQAQARAAARTHDAEMQAELQRQISEASANEEADAARRAQQQQQANAQFAADQADKLSLIERAHQQQVTQQEQLNSIQEQTHQNQIARLEQQRAAYASLRDEINGYAQPLVSNFVGALSKVIAGTESADKAFQGLLSSFLQFISEQAALKAAFEFAEAIASAATFNYAGAAQHAAAGALFTVVAIAAGAGAIATAPSTAPAGAPAAQPQQGGGTTNYTIVWNSPVVTAQDRAELGRSLNQVSAQSTRRFASSV